MDGGRVDSRRLHSDDANPAQRLQQPDEETPETATPERTLDAQRIQQHDAGRLIAVQQRGG